MAEFGDAFDKIMDVGLWRNVAILGAAFVAGIVLKNTVEGRISMDLPDEVYGVVIVAASTMFLTGTNRRMATMGGALYTVEAVARRLGVKDRAAGLGA